MAQDVFISDSDSDADEFDSATDEIGPTALEGNIGPSGTTLLNYQIVDELYRTAFGSVCTVKSTGAAATSNTFVVKIFQTSTNDVAEAGVAPIEDQSAGLAAFIKSVEIQKEAGESCKFWAPVLETGSSGNSAYFVTNYYPRTAQKLLAGRVVLDATALHEIMNSVVKGLVEFKRVLGRAHGNLKPSNVLISGRGGVADAKIALTDPSPTDCNNAEAESADARSLGALLYQLVMHRQFHPTAWPVAESEEWARMGRRGHAWWKLCSELLHHDPKSRPDLATIQRSLSAMKVRRFPVGKLAAAVIGFLTIAGAGAWGLMKWEQAIRLELTTADAGWFSVLNDPTQSNLFAADPRFSSIGLNDKNRQELIQASLKGEGWELLKPATVRQILAARSIPNDSRHDWTQAFAGESSELSDKVNSFQPRGWKVPPALASVPVLPNPPAARDIIAGVAQLHDLRKRIANNDPTERWSVLDRQLTDLKTAKNGIVPRFAESLRKIAADSVTLTDKNWNVGSGIEDCIVRATRLRQKQGIEFDQARFAKEEPDINLNQPSLQDVDRWLNTVDLYVVVPGAGEKSANVCQTEYANAILDPIKANPAQWKAANPEFKSAQEAIAQKILAIRKGTFLVKDVRHDSESSGPLYAQRTAVKGLIEDLAQSAYVAPENPADFVASLPRLFLKDTQLLDIWSHQIDDLASKKAGDFSAAQWTQRKAQIQALSLLLKACDGFTPVPELAEPYKSIAENRRKAILGPILQNLGSSASLTADSTATLQASVSQSSVAYAQWVNQVKDLAGDFPTVPKENEILEVSQFPDQPWKDGKAPEKKAFWDTQVAQVDGPFYSVLNSYSNRLDSLRDIQAGSLEELTALASKTGAAPAGPILVAWHERKNNSGLDASVPASPDMLVAAWRRLSRQGLFAEPARVDRLAVEGEIRGNLAAVWAAIQKKNLIAGDALLKDLNQEVNRGPQRWCDAFKAAQSPADIQSALATSPQFGLNFAISPDPLPAPGKSAEKWLPGLAMLAPNLGPVGYYNLAMSLTQNALAGNNADLIRCDLDAILSAVNQLPAASRANLAPLASWVKSKNFTYDEEFRTELKATLADSDYLLPPPTSPPSFLAQVLPAAKSLAAQKNIDSAIILLVGFVDRERATLPPQMRAEWSAELITLANALQPGGSSNAVAAMQRSAMLGNLDAILRLGLDQPDPKNAVAVLSGAASSNVKAELLLAQMTERGIGVPPSIDEARRLYTLADKKGDPVAHDWLARDAASRVVVVKHDPNTTTTPPVTNPPKENTEGSGSTISKIKIRAGN